MRHRLQERERQAFALRHEDEEVRGCEQVRDVAAVAENAHVCIGRLLDLGAQLSLADDEK